MKVNRWLSRGMAALMTFAIAYAGVGCLATGFEMEFRSGEWSGLVWALIAAAVVCTACFQFKKGWLAILGLMAVLGLVAVNDESILEALEGFLAKITARYNAAYGWKILQWSETDYSHIRRHINMAAGLTAVGTLVTVAVSWVLCRKKPAAVAVAVAAVPLGACCLVTDTVPSEGYLGLLLGSAVLLIMTQGARRRSTADGLRLTAMLMVPVMLASMALFWIAPRDSYEAQTSAIQQTVLRWLQDLPFVNWDDQQGGFTGSGQWQTVDLADVGPKVQTKYPVMDVLAEKQQTLYLRGQSFDWYDGVSWSNSELSTGEDPGWQTGSMEQLGSLTVATRYLQEMIYVPYGYSSVLYLKDGTVENTENASEFLYNAVIRDGGEDPEGRLEKILQQCLQLPKTTADAAEKILTVPAGLSNGQKAQLIGAYVQSCAEYSLQTEKMPEGTEDFAIWFLTQSDTGYCVHYATAATVLLRAAGVPARYVTGYSQQVGNRPAEVTTITSDRAHAWVEYWDEVSGWTVLDPTPPSWYSGTESTGATETEATQTSGTESAATESSEATLPTQTQHTAGTEESTAQSGQTQATQPSQAGPGDGTTGGQADRSWLRGILIALAGILAAAGVILGQYWLRVSLRRKKMDRGDCNQRALYRWRYAEKVARRMDLELPKRLTKLAEKAAFSQHTLTEPEVAEFDAWLAQVRKIRTEKPWPARIGLKLIWAME